MVFIGNLGEILIIRDINMILRKIRAHLLRRFTDARIFHRMPYYAIDYFCRKAALNFLVAGHSYLASINLTFRFFLSLIPNLTCRKWSKEGIIALSLNTYGRIYSSIYDNTLLDRR